MPNMLNIQLLGTVSPKYQIVLNTLNNYLIRSGLEFHIKEYNRVDDFIHSGIEFIPSIIYNGQTYGIGDNGNFNETLRYATKQILEDEDFGTIPKIMIPFDFSDVSLNALAYGHRLATELKAITKLVHVYYPKASTLLNNEEDTLENRKEKFDAIVKQFDKDWQSDFMKTSLISSSFITGFPGDELSRHIENKNYHLTIMGTSGNQDRLKNWFGSVSQKVMNNANGPLLLVPQKAKYRSIKKIVYAYDKVTQDVAVLDQLIQFAKPLNAEIHLVHINTENYHNHDTALKNILEKKYPSENVFQESIFHSDIPNGLNLYCELYDIDIVSLSTHKKSRLEYFFDDNISIQVTNTQSRPVLILKTEK